MIFSLKRNKEKCIASFFSFFMDNHLKEFLFTIFFSNLFSLNFPITKYSILKKNNINMKINESKLWNKILQQKNPI